MKHIFISHAGKDSVIAEKLCEDLKNVGHEVRIDLKELTLGDDSIQFMNDAIANAHTNIVIFSCNTANAKWQKLEINAAVWSEIEQNGGKVIVDAGRYSLAARAWPQDIRISEARRVPGYPTKTVRCRSAPNL